MIVAMVSLCIGVACAGMASVVVRPDRLVERRVDPYVQHVRFRAGERLDPGPPNRVPASLTGVVLSPLSSLVQGVIERSIDPATPQQLSTRLRRAGETDARPQIYRMRQLRAAVIGAVAGGVLLSWVSFLTGGLWPLAAAAGVLVGMPSGAAWYRSNLEQRAAQRARVLRVEVYSITVALSVLCRAGVGPIGALRHVAQSAAGVLAHDLRLGLSWMDRGADGADVLERLARDSPEPAVGRLLRALASAGATGRNPAGALRDLAEQLRRQRIEQLDQWATKRRAAMLLPTILLMFPVLLLYVLAPGALVLLGL